MLMTICSLGAHWREDPSKIPVEEIVKVWRSGSVKGRYESVMWKAAGLNEPLSALQAARKAAAAGLDQVEAKAIEPSQVEESEVDNVQAGGFFARWGRDPKPADSLHPRGVHAGMHL